jgi:hypothetical protein
MKSSGCERSLYTTITTTTQIFDVAYNPDILSLGMYVCRHQALTGHYCCGDILPFGIATLYDILIVGF